MKTEAPPSDGLGIDEPWEATPPKPERGGRHRIRKVLIGFGLLVLFFLILGATAFAWMYHNTTVPTAPPLIQTSYLYDRNGHLITTLHAAVDRTIVPFSDMPEVLRNAVVATEDANFYQHPGIDPAAIARAAWTDVTHGSIVEGGSTITQQYVKNVYTGDQISFGRKFREALLALRLDSELTKNQILARYLNTIYFGHGAYGLQSAAETYWNIPAKDLNLAESATLAGVIAAPSKADPISHPLEAQKRRNGTLELMVAHGYINRSEADKIEQLPVQTHPAKPETNFSGAYFADYTRHLLETQFGASQVAGGGLRVTTTLDLGMQKAAEDAVRKYLPSRKDPEAAVVAIDPRSGEIRALVGGRDFSKSQVDLATGDCEGCLGRQAGSAFKPFTLAAAFESGISPLSKWKGPPSLTIRDPNCGSQPWRVANYADESAGTMTLLDATANSVNTIFAQVVAQVGPQAVVDVAHSMGITSNLQPVCSITLGSQSVTPLEMASAFGTLADQGMHYAPTAVLSVKNSSGAELASYPSQGSPGLDEGTSNLVTYALEGVVQHGTGTAAQLNNRPVAGKTGTAQNFSNAWFCGYTPQLVTCVWMGYPKGNIPMHNVEGVPEVFGGSIPAAIWHVFMQQATRGMPVESFPKPDLSQFSKGKGPDAAKKGADASPAPVAAGPLESPIALPTSSPIPGDPNSPTPGPIGSPRPSPKPAKSPHPNPSPSPAASGFAAAPA